MRDKVYVICEGKCNPNLRDYDTMMRRSKEENDPRLMLFALGIKPVHTPHHQEYSPVTHRPKEVWVAGTGFFFLYRCDICNHPRKF